MTTELLANNYTTTLSGNGGSISAGATSFNIVGTLPAALQAAGQFRVIIDQEIIIVPGGQTGPTLSGVTRGAETAQNGGPAAAHNDGAIVAHAVTAAVVASVMTTSSPRFVTAILTPSGGDDSTALQTAINALSGFGQILLAPGTFLWNTAAVSLPRNATGITIRGSGRGATTIKLSTAAPRFLDCPYVADFDVYQNIFVEDLTVDCNSIAPATNNHVVIGNLIGGNWAQRQNVAHVRVRRVNTINVPTDNTIGHAARQNVSFGSRHLGSGEATQTSLTDIVAEDCNFQGGNYGFAVIGTGATPVNVFMDGNGVNGLIHDTLVTPATGGAANAAHVQIGGTGFGETAFIWRLTGLNSGDVGTEVDGHMSLSAYACTITDSWNTAFLSCSFQQPRDPYSQIYRYRDCRVKLTTAITIPATHVCAGWECGSPNVPAAQWFGHVLIDGCAHDSANAAFNANGFAVTTRATAGVRRVTLRSFEANAPSVNQTLAADGGMAAIYFDPSAVVPFTLKIDGCRIRVAGTTTLSGHAFNSIPFWVSGTDAAGADITLDIRDLMFDWNMAGTAASSTKLMLIGPPTNPAVVPKFRGAINFRVGSFAGGDTSPWALFVQDHQGAGTPIINLDNDIMCRDCDAHLLPVGSAGTTGQIGREISSLNTRGTGTGQWNVFTPGLRFCATGSAAGLPRAASPGTLATTATFVNRTGSAIMLWFTGAITTTAISVGVRSDTTLSIVTGQTGNGPYFLPPGGAITWTGTGGPATLNYVECAI